MKRRCLLIAIMLLVLIPAGCVQVPVSGQWDFGTKKALVYASERIGQDFYVSDRNLTRLDISLYPSKIIKAGQTPPARRAALRQLKGKNLIMTLYALPQKKRLLSRPLAAGKIRAARMYAFTFEPVAGSKRQRYYFELTAPGLERESALAVRITGADRYREGEVFVNGKRRAGADLGFQAYIDMTPIILMHSVASRVAGDAAFFAFWGFMVVSVLAAAVYARRREVHLGTSS